MCVFDLDNISVADVQIDRVDSVESNPFSKVDQLPTLARETRWVERNKSGGIAHGIKWISIDVLPAAAVALSVQAKWDASFLYVLDLITMSYTTYTDYVQY